MSIHFSIFTVQLMRKRKFLLFQNFLFSYFKACVHNHMEKFQFCSLFLLTRQDKGNVVKHLNDGQLRIESRSKFTM